MEGGWDYRVVGLGDMRGLKVEESNSFNLSTVSYSILRLNGRHSIEIKSRLTKLYGLVKIA